MSPSFLSPAPRPCSSPNPHGRTQYCPQLHVHWKADVINALWDFLTAGRAALLSIQKRGQLLTWNEGSQAKDAETTVIDFTGSGFRQTGIEMIIGEGVLEVASE